MVRTQVILILISLLISLSPKLYFEMELILSYMYKAYLWFEHWIVTKDWCYLEDDSFSNIHVDWEWKSTAVMIIMRPSNLDTTDLLLFAETEFVRQQS